MSQLDGFYTMKGYELNTDGELTSAMEDYLEMIFRLMRQNKPIKISNLSKMFHVKASSATKMVQQLGLGRFIQAQKYRDIYLTDKGQEI